MKKFKVGDIVVITGNDEYLRDNSVNQNIKTGYRGKATKLNSNSFNIDNITANFISYKQAELDEVYKTEIYQALIEANLDE